MIILKQLEKKNKSIQIFPFVMKDDYLIVVLTIFRMVKDTKKEIKESFFILTNIYVLVMMQHIDKYQYEVSYERIRNRSYLQGFGR